MQGRSWLQRHALGLNRSAGPAGKGKHVLAAHRLPSLHLLFWETMSSGEVVEEGQGCRKGGENCIRG